MYWLSAIHSFWHSYLDSSCPFLLSLLEPSYDLWVYLIDLQYFYKPVVWDRMISFLIIHISCIEVSFLFSRLLHHHLVYNQLLLTAIIAFSAAFLFFMQYIILFAVRLYFTCYTRCYYLILLASTLLAYIWLNLCYLPFLVAYICYSSCQTACN